jgi:hypothetical protein
MHTFTKKLGLSTLLATLLIGCKPSQPSTLQKFRPEKTYDLYETDRLRLTNLEAERKEQSTLSRVLSQETTSPSASPPKNSSFTSFLSLLPLTHPFCYNTNHLPTLQKKEKEQRMQEETNKVLTTQLLTQSYRLAGIEEQQKREEKNVAMLSSNYTRSLNVNKKLETELTRAYGDLDKAIGLARFFEKRVKTLQEQKEEDQQEERQQANEREAVQKLCAVPGYQVPSMPLITARVEQSKKGSRLEEVTTQYSLFPPILTCEADFKKIVIHIGALYTPTNATGSFATWMQEAGLPTNTFSSYMVNRETYDQFAQLCKATANANRTLLPGIVLWKDKEGKSRLLSTPATLEKWMREK